MKNTCFFLLMMLPIFLFGQKNNFQIGIYAAPNIMYKTNSISSETHDALVGYNFGISTLIPTKSDRFYFVSGIQFSAYGEQFGGKDTLRWGSQHNGSGGWDPKLPGEGLTNEGKVRDFFLDLPIGVRYYYSTGNWKFYVQPSVDLTFYLSSRTTNKTTFADPDSPDRETVVSGGYSNIRNSNFAATLGLGIERVINEKVNFFFQPTGMIHLMDTAKDSVTASRLFAFSGRTGLSFKF